PLADRIKNGLTETRVALPGAQALLGFQFLSILTQSFGSLPRPVQDVHLASLGAVALATMCLITPAAWHRIVEEGEDTERFHKVASVLVLSALFFIVLGDAGDLFVVLMMDIDSPACSGCAAVDAPEISSSMMFVYVS